MPEKQAFQASMELVLMQIQGGGMLEVVFAPAVATAGAVFPAPPFGDR